MTRLQDLSSTTSCSEYVQLDTQASTPYQHVLQRITVPIFKDKVIVIKHNWNTQPKKDWAGQNETICIVYN